MNATKSGWCMDAVQALALDFPAGYAKKLHDSCPSAGCPCHCHERIDDDIR